MERRTIPDYLYSEDEDDDVTRCNGSNGDDVTKRHDESNPVTNGNGNGTTNPFRKQIDEVSISSKVILFQLNVF